MTGQNICSRGQSSHPRKGLIIRPCDKAPVSVTTPLTGCGRSLTRPLMQPTTIGSEMRSLLLQLRPAGWSGDARPASLHILFVGLGLIIAVGLIHVCAARLNGFAAGPTWMPEETTRVYAYSFIQDRPLELCPTVLTDAERAMAAAAQPRVAEITLGPRTCPIRRG